MYVSAQDIIFNVKSYKGGYNVSCKNSTDGFIDATIVGGVSPYTYNWNNGATTQDLSNVGAGIYTLTVTDAIGTTKSKSVTLFEADLLEVFFATTLYDGGYQISKMGANDGAITTDVKGGAPPYKYQWNNGSQKSNLDKLTAGVYTVVITDQNGCTTTKTKTLLEPTPIVINLTASTYGSYNTSCFDSRDGNINITVSGGLPPYKFNWSNGSFDEDLTNVPAGKYQVQVYDANKANATGEIILTQPNRLSVDLTTNTFPNGYNISCSDCSNGSVSSTVTGGTMPSSYLWKGRGVEGFTSANLTNVGPGDYVILVTDANGCKTENKIYLTEPPVSGWDKNGNTLDNTNFLGSTNNTPLVLKTNNTEKFRIAENGDVGIGTSSPQTKLDVLGNSQISGDLKIGGNFTFAGDKVLGYLPAADGSPEIFSIGTQPNPSVRSVTSCLNPYVNVPFKYQFKGSIQLWGNNVNGGNLNVLETGFDGSNGFIEMAGSSSIGGPALLLNYYCGKDIFMCTGTNGGNISMASANGKVGIGVYPTEKFEVNGNVKISSLSGGANKIVLADANGVLNSTSVTAALTTAGLGLWETTNNIDIFHQAGKVGIGTNNPFGTLDIKSDRTNLGGEGAQVNISGTTNPEKSLQLGFETSHNYGVISTLHLGIAWGEYPLVLQPSGGGVAIGTTNTAGFALSVNGNVRAKDIFVTLDGWGDFVFEESYSRMSVLDKEAFYKKEKHLPNITSAKEIETNGLQVGTTMNGMMQNIEENTLDIADLYKRMILLEKENSELKESLKTLKNN
jgi:hypothetical protein